MLPIRMLTTLHPDKSFVNLIYCENNNRSNKTHNRLSPLFYREFVIGITVILRVKVWLVNVSLPYTFSFSFTGITGLRFCFILFVLLFIWKKVNRKEWPCELVTKPTLFLINIKQQKQYPCSSSVFTDPTEEISV